MSRTGTPARRVRVRGTVQDAGPRAALAIAVLGTGILAGCAHLGGSPGTRFLRAGEYASAVSAYEVEEAEHPQDPVIKRDFGAALYHVDELDRARQKLKASESLNDRDRHLFYFLGRVEDRAGDPAGALRSYSRHLALGGKNTPFLRGRVEELGRAIAAARLRKSRLLETSLAESLAAKPPPPNTLAVTEFANLSGGEDLEALSRGLAAVLILDLVKVGEFRVLERTRIQTILDELALSGAPSPPPATGDTARVAMSEQRAAEERKSRAAVVGRFAPRLGWVLQARHLVQGSILTLSEDRIQLGAQVLEVLSDSLAGTGPPITGALEDVLPAEKKLVVQVLDYFGIKPLPEEKKRIDELPTDDFLAFLAFSRGLLLEDRGDRAGARAAYAAALAQDGGFRLARERIEILAAAQEGAGGPDRAEVDQMVRGAVETDMAWRILEDVGQAPLPDADRGSLTAGGREPNGDKGDSDDARIGDSQLIGARALPGFPNDPWGSRKR
jgi:TolB-like protein